MRLWVMEGVERWWMEGGGVVCGVVCDGMGLWVGVVRDGITITIYTVRSIEMCSMIVSRIWRFCGIGLLGTVGGL